jgi:uncharacterized phiE125 gp8 family phage protein
MSLQHSSHEMELSRPTVVTGPTSEPVTLAEARRQLFLAEGDTSQDAELTSRIQAAREQWEHDTDSVLFTRTLSVTSERFAGREIQLESRPVTSITHIKYYDENDTLQTFSSSKYSLNAAEREIELDWNEVWPTTATRWDAITITYVAGIATVATIPAIAKQAMLLLIAYYHYGNRGDNDRPNDLRAYENLVRRYQRSSYP